MATETKKQEIFSFDILEENADSYFDETEERGNAAITFQNGMLTLIVINFRDADVTVYHTKETPELYDAMAQEYIRILEEQSSGNDFWDMWSATTTILEPFKIVDEVLNA